MSHHNILNNDQHLNYKIAYLQQNNHQNSYAQLSQHSLWLNHGNQMQQQQPAQNFDYIFNSTQKNDVLTTTNGISLNQQLNFSNIQQQQQQQQQQLVCQTSSQHNLHITQMPMFDVNLDNLGYTNLMQNRDQQNSIYFQNANYQDQQQISKNH